jgi:uncharacterized protein (TIGR03435 family)
LRFEVASIRPREASDHEPSNRQMLPGGRFVATGTTVRTLLRIAFGTDDDRMVGVPSWTGSETFDIDATVAGHVEITRPEQFQQVLLSLLEERFQLKFHREEKKGPIYWLVLDKPGKTGPALKTSKPDAVAQMSNNSNGQRTEMRIAGMSMADIAAGLRRQAGRPVEDHTGLTGKYDFQIEWSPALSTDATDPTLSTVLKEQLGLKLQSAEGSTESIVIDQISHPSAN